MVSTTNWYYSTEFRVLYTQLIMGPLFRICNNWHVIRTITNLVFYGLMLASYYYFMKPLKVSRRLTVLSSCLLLLPFSETMMTHMQMGNTYMSHVILVLWFFGMYLRIQYKTQGQPVDLLCTTGYCLWNVRRTLPAGITVPAGTDFLFLSAGW